MTIASFISRSIANCTKFWQSGNLQNRSILILRVCQLVWSASMLVGIVAFLIMVLCSTAGICSETFNDITVNIASAFFLISIFFYFVSFIIRAIFIKFASHYLTDIDFIDHLKAKRLYLAILLMNTKGRPASDILIGAGMICNEYEIAKMSGNMNSDRGINRPYRSRRKQSRKISLHGQC